MPQKGLNPPSHKAMEEKKGDGAWGSGKTFLKSYLRFLKIPTFSR